MHYRISILAFCVVLLGFTNSEKVDNKAAYVASRDDIFIDEPQADMLEGSAVDREFTEDLESSGGGTNDDEDSTPDGSGFEEGSGSEPPFITVKPNSKINAEFKTPATTSTTTTTTTISTTSTTEHVNSIAVKPSPTKLDNQIPEGTVSTKTVLDKTHHSHDGNQVDNNVGPILGQTADDRPPSFFAQPGILAAVIGGAVVGLLCAILLVMFIVYRMRKKDEGSYPLDEPKRSPTVNSYTRNTKEFYA